MERDNQNNISAHKILASPYRSSSNPYLTLLYTSLGECGYKVDKYSSLKALSGRYAIIHIHWPEHHFRVNTSFFPTTLVRTFIYMLVLGTAKLRGSKIVWTLHNLVSHQNRRPWYEHTVLSIFIRLVNGIICMSDESKRLLINRYPVAVNRNFFVIPHGHYKDWYGPERDVDGARNFLGLSKQKTVLLYIGTIKKYKNVPMLIRAFRQLNPDKYELIIAGDCKEPRLKNDIENAVGNLKNVLVHFGYVEEKEVATYLAAADAVILPFTEILNSGTILLALSYNRPVLTHKSVSLEELQKRVGDDNLIMLESIEQVDKFRDAIEIISNQKNTNINLESLSWDKIGKETASSLQAIIE